MKTLCLVAVLTGLPLLVGIDICSAQSPIFRTGPAGMNFQQHGGMSHQGTQSGRYTQQRQPSQVLPGLGWQSIGPVFGQQRLESTYGQSGPLQWSEWKVVGPRQMWSSGTGRSQLFCPPDQWSQPGAAWESGPVRRIVPGGVAAPIENPFGSGGTVTKIRERQGSIGETTPIDNPFGTNGSVGPIDNPFGTGGGTAPIDNPFGTGGGTTPINNPFSP